METEKYRIGWIGTGVMGNPMATHLLDAGYPLTVFSRTRAKAESLLARGAQWANSPMELAQNVDIVFAIVGYPKDVREVFLGKKGVIGSVKPASIAVDMTTSEPSLAVEMAEAFDQRGCKMLDAPVSGGQWGAEKAELAIMVGGEAAPFETVRPLFECMGKRIVHVGPPGAGQHCKMVNQTLIAGTMIGVAEGLLYAQRNGLDTDKVLEAVSSGAAGSWSLSNLGPRMLDGDFRAGFFVDHFVKDMTLALAEAGKKNLPLPGLALVRQLYVALQAQGRGHDGTQALWRILEQLGGK